MKERKWTSGEKIKKAVTVRDKRRVSDSREGERENFREILLIKRGAQQGEMALIRGLC